MTDVVGGRFQIATPPTTGSTVLELSESVVVSQLFDVMEGRVSKDTLGGIEVMVEPGSVTEEPLVELLLSKTVEDGLFVVADAPADRLVSCVVGSDDEGESDVTDELPLSELIVLLMDSSGTELELGGSSVDVVLSAFSPVVLELEISSTELELGGGDIEVVLSVFCPVMLVLEPSGLALEPAGGNVEDVSPVLSPLMLVLPEASGSGLELGGSEVEVELVVSGPVMLVLEPSGPELEPDGSDVEVISSAFCLVVLVPLAASGTGFEPGGSDVEVELEASGPVALAPLGLSIGTGLLDAEPRPELAVPWPLEDVVPSMLVPVGLPVDRGPLGAESTPELATPWLLVILAVLDVEDNELAAEESAAVPFEVLAFCVERCEVASESDSGAFVPEGCPVEDDGFSVESSEPDLVLDSPSEFCVESG